MVVSLLETSGVAGPTPEVVAPTVGPAFEFGTETFRTSVYARSVLRSVPPGVPVIASDDPAAWNAATLLARRNPAIFVVHCDHERDYQKLARHTASAAAIVCISRRIEETVHRRFSGAASLIVRIPIGLTLRSHALARPSDHRKSAHLLWIGRMDEEHKRVSDLAKIAARLSQMDRAFVLTVVGDGPARTSLEAAVDAAGLRDRVRFTGWMRPDEVRKQLAEADLLLLPSNREGLPVVMIEALAAGCGVVASRVSGVEDYESHPLAKGCLRVHSVGDTDAAAGHVTDLMASSPADRARQARALATAEFSIARCADRYAQLIESLPCPRIRPSGTLRIMAHLIALASLPVATQRRLRVWARNR
jgi:glycosyltransferase involved in cell wall biosynthesis